MCASPVTAGPRVLLSGYYGAGNLGDDLLLKVTYSVVRERFPARDIAIAAWSPDYIPDLLSEQCPILPRKSVPPSIEAVVAGGGGIYYSFRGGRIRAACAQLLLNSLGVRPVAAARNVVRRMRAGRGRRETAIRHAAAYGIGIGPFAFGSWAEPKAALKLAAADWVCVRDSDSYAACRRWRLPSQLVESTDPAFLYQRWAPAGTPRERVPRPGGKPRVAVVVRDWKHSRPRNEYLEPLVEAVDALRCDGVGCTYASFHPEQDEVALAHLPGERILAWDPRRLTLARFVQQFRAFDLVVTARAHGAILAACLGIPSISVAIEPKLRNASQMLAPAAGLWPPPYGPAELSTTAKRMIEDGEELRSRLRAVVVERNRQAADAAAQLGAFLAERLLSRAEP